MMRVLLLALCLALAPLCAEEPAPTVESVDAASAKGLKALDAAQENDGAIRSITYGIMKPGVATTAFYVELLSRVPEVERAKHKAALDKALEFLYPQIDDKGSIGAKTEWLDYPAYSTALFATALNRLKPEGWKERHAKLIEWLRANQFSEACDVKPDHAAFGGWSPNGLYEKNAQIRADISVARYVLTALAEAGVPADDPVWARAAVYLKRSQNLDADGKKGDGGFHYTTTTPVSNKAEADEAAPTGFRSYGTATVDGALCLAIISKLDEAHAKAVAEQLAQAKKWIEAHPNLDVIPGFKADSNNQKMGWDRAMIYYYRAGLVQAVKALGIERDAAWWNEAANLTMKAQQKDGFWANELAFMKENDPLVATPHALEVLLEYRNHHPK